MGEIWKVAGGLALLALAVFLWRRWRTMQWDADRRRGMFEFDERRDSLAAEFLRAAAATGKPRGLRWKSCELSGPPLFAVDASLGELYALTAVTISFEAIEGGDMEEVEAVGNLRAATAVFVYRRDQWTTDGRVIFNLEPAEALQRFNATLRPVEATQ